MAKVPMLGPTTDFNTQKFITVFIKGSKWPAMLDTGAAVSICSQKFVQCVKLRMRKTDQVVLSANNTELNIFGKLNLRLQIEGKFLKLMFWLQKRFPMTSSLAQTFWENTVPSSTFRA